MRCASARGGFFVCGECEPRRCYERTFHFIDRAASFSSSDAGGKDAGGLGAGFAWGRGAAADRALMESAMRLAFASALSTFTLTIWPAFDHFARVFDVAIRELADVDQAVLVHADIDEGAELVTLVTTPSSTMPGCTSAISRTSSWKLGATNLSRGSRPGLRALPECRPACKLRPKVACGQPSRAARAADQFVDRSRATRDCSTTG